MEIIRSIIIMIINGFITGIITNGLIDNEFIEGLSPSIQ